MNTETTGSKCQYGRCTRKALYSVTEEYLSGVVNGEVVRASQTFPSCSQHRIAVRNEAWSTGSLVTAVKI